MKYTPIIMLLAVLGLNFNAHADDESSGTFVNFINCENYLTQPNGDVPGMVNIYLQQDTRGDWYLYLGEGFRVLGGKNIATEDGKLEFSNYHWYSSEGVEASYDYNTKVIKILYKYDSGILGGGAQVTEGTVKNCKDGKF